MVVGKPDFNLNSFGIQYKEKRVNYTTKRIGMNSQVTTDTEDASEHAQWSKMDTPQSNNSKKRGEKPNAVQAAGNAPIETVSQPKRSKYGRQDPIDIVQPATSSPPSPAPEESTNVTVDVPNTKEEMVTREGGGSHVGMKPKTPKVRIAGRADQEATIKLLEEKGNPKYPKRYTPPTEKELVNIRGTDKPSKIKDGEIIEGKRIPEKQRDPKGRRGDKKRTYTPQRLASIKSNNIITKMKIMKLDLMNKKDVWDKGEKINDKKRVNHKNTWDVKPRELTQESPEVEDPDISMRVADDEHFAGKDRKTGKITDEKKLIPAIRVGDHPSSKEGFIPSGLGLKHRDTKYTTSGVTGNKKLSDKDRAYNLTPAMMTESYESAKLHKAADETIFKAISLKLDLMKDALDPNAKPQDDLLGNPNTALPKNTRVGQKPPYVHDLGDTEEDYGTFEQLGNPFEGSTTRQTARGIARENKPRTQTTNPDAKYYKNPKVERSDETDKQPRTLK